MRKARWTAGVLLALAFPVAAVIAGTAYLVLRHKWSDRLVAGVLTLVGAVATWYAMLSLSYWTAWWHVFATVTRVSRLLPGQAHQGDWTTLVGIGLALGPLLGGLVWMAAQLHRERS